MLKVELGLGNRLPLHNMTGVMTLDGIGDTQLDITPRRVNSLDLFEVRHG